MTDNDTSVHAVSHVAQSFSSKQGENGATHFRTTRGRGRSSSHRDHQVAGPRYDKPHYKPHQGKPPHWMSAKSCPGCACSPRSRTKSTRARRVVSPTVGLGQSVQSLY